VEEPVLRPRIEHRKDVRVLEPGGEEHLAAAGLDFVRVEGFAFAHVADEGILESSAASLLRFRRHIGEEIPGSLYAKVEGPVPGSSTDYTVRSTSMSPEIRTFLRGHRR
jgi:predicted TIM-barrel enzyme